MRKSHFQNVLAGALRIFYPATSFFIQFFYVSDAQDASVSFFAHRQLNHHSSKVSGKVRRKVKPNEIEEARCHTISGSFRGSFRTALRCVKKSWGQNYNRILRHDFVKKKINTCMTFAADAMFSVILRRS